MSTRALSNVNPCDLCRVIAQARFRCIRCVSCEKSYKSDSFVSDIMRTHQGMSERKLGPIYVLSNFTMTAIGKARN